MKSEYNFDQVICLYSAFLGTSLECQADLELKDVALLYAKYISSIGNIGMSIFHWRLLQKHIKEKETVEKEKEKHKLASSGGALNESDESSSDNRRRHQQLMLMKKPFG